MVTQPHYFLAVPLPEPLKEDFSTYMKNLKRVFPFTRWVHPADLHLTMAFLGYVNEEKRSRLTEAMKRVTLNHSAFPLTLGGLHTFGNPSSPKVFWQGVGESVPLAQLRNNIYEGCEEIGFQLDQRPFHPHITLARKWNGAQALKEETLKAYSTKKETFDVKEIILYETNLHKMPKYGATEIYSLI